MKKMVIYEPAMCCSTGVCGPSVDPELLRISNNLNNLRNNSITVERYNLTSNPLAFAKNEEVKRMIETNGVEILPITMVDDKVVKIKVYPTDDEFCKFLDITEKYLKGTVVKVTKGCGCKSGCCS